MPPHGQMRAPAKPKNAKGTFRRLVSYLAPHKGKLIAVAGCIIFSTAASATGTFLLKDVVNSYIQPLIGQAAPDLWPFAQFLLLMLGMYLADHGGDVAVHHVL